MPRPILAEPADTTATPGAVARVDEAAMRRRLRGLRVFASGLLALMAVVAGLASWAAQHGRAGWSLLAAAATAGLVGGLADWFAVTALFRRPLGLPIPHTAIVPAQKRRLGEALGRFIAHHVLTEADLVRALARLDLPAMVARTLAEPAVSEAIARGAARLLPRMLSGLGNGRGQALLAAALRRALGGRAAGPLLGRALRAMLASDRHQAVMSALIERLRQMLRDKEPMLRGFVEQRVCEQGGRLVGWALGSAVASRVLTAMAEEIDRLDPEGSELRQAVTQWLQAEIERIETDAERAREIGQAFAGVLAHPAMQDWLQSLWMRLHAAAEADAEHPLPWIAGVVQEALGRLGPMLAQDAGLRDRLDRSAAQALRSLLPQLQAQVAGFVGNVMGGWDAQTLADRLELRVGRDLQYIRVNGTVFGFLAGGVVHLMLAQIAKVP